MILQSVTHTHISTRQHVLVDLRPYVCIYRECGDPDRTYPSQSMFFEHEALKHQNTGVYWINCIQAPDCLFCGEKLPDTDRGRHVGRHMEEIAFLVVTKPYEDWEFYSDGASNPSLSGVPHSPLESPDALLTQTLQDDSAHRMRHFPDVDFSTSGQDDWTNYHFPIDPWAPQGTIEHPYGLPTYSGMNAGLLYNERSERDVRVQLYYNADPNREDGLYHCPDPNKDGCTRTEKLKCNYE